MWYVKHPFDCIVVGALAGMVGASTKPGYASQTAEVKGASSRTQSFQRSSWNWADVRAEECEKQNTQGALVPVLCIGLGQESKTHATHAA